MKIFYFTATGNSLNVAKHFEAELYSIPQVLKEKNLTFEDEKIGIIFPTYAFSTPKIVVDFFKEVTLKAPYIFFISTNGGSAGGSINYLLKVSKKKGVNISYTNSVTMVDNYVKLFVHNVGLLHQTIDKVDVIIHQN